MGETETGKGKLDRADHGKVDAAASLARKGMEAAGVLAAAAVALREFQKRAGKTPPEA